MQDDTQYTKAFRQYLRTGMDQALEALLGNGPDPEGGYPAPAAMQHRIEQAVYDGSPLRQLAGVSTIRCDSLSVAKAEGPWSGSLEEQVVPTHELYAQPKATQRLVDDASLDFEVWLSAKAADIFARKENEAFIIGTGLGMPHGLLPYAQQGKIEVRRSGVDGEVTAHGVLDLYRSLPNAHAKNAWFIMNRTTVQAVRQLQDPTTSEYLWHPGLSAGAPDTLAGVPVQMVTNMPLSGAGTLAVACGDFQAGYRIVDRPGIRILRDPFTEKPFVKFITTKRVGGDVINPNAIKFMALAA